jgi:hypothetical protein
MTTNDQSAAVAAAEIEIQFQTAHGPASEATVDAWELKAARRALRNLKTLLYGERMRQLLQEQMAEADRRVKEILAVSHGEFRECRVDVIVKGLTATQFIEAMASALKGLMGTPSETVEVGPKLLSSHPEHYVFTQALIPPYQGIVETIGGLPTRLKTVVPPDVSPDDLPAFVASAASDAYPIKQPSRIELDDGTVMAWLLHQYRDTEAGCEIILRVWWPAAAPDIFFDEHAQHFAVEFRNFIRMAAADLATSSAG